MGLPKEQGPVGLSLIQRLLTEVERVVFRQAERGERGKLEEKVVRFLALGKTLAQNIGAFEGLALKEGLERDFFVERLSLNLFHALCPLNPNTNPEETLNGKQNNISPVLDKYFGGQFQIEETFLPDDNLEMRSLKRALDYAARNAFGVIAKDLKEGGQNQEFVSSVIRFFKKGINPQTSLYAPSEKAKEGLDWVFERGGKEIAGFRQAQGKPHSVPESVVLKVDDLIHLSNSHYYHRHTSHL